jgi:hypothetical protein
MRLLLPCLLTGLTAAIAGCNSATETTAAVPATPAAPIATAPVVESPKPAVSAAHTPELADPKETNAAQVVEFTPPFPDRLELFEPPKSAQNTVRRDDEHGESVELKGFITVDEPRVILSIDNVIAIIPEGGEKYGVRVRSIQPPKVILERGRNVWPATLE